MFNRRRVYAFAIPNQFRRAISQRQFGLARVCAIAGGMWI